MDTRSTLHWGTIVLALFALTWMLVSYVGPLVYLLPIFGIAGAALVMVNKDRAPETQRGLLLTGTILIVAVYGLWLVLQLGAVNVNIKAGGDTFDREASNTAGEIASNLGSWLGVIAAAGIVLALWAFWDQRERIIGATGAGIILVQQILSVTGAGGEAMSTILSILFPLGFLVLAVAALLPLFTDTDNPAWQRDKAGASP